MPFCLLDEAAADFDDLIWLDLCCDDLAFELLLDLGFCVLLLEILPDGFLADAPALLLCAFLCGFAFDFASFLDIVFISD